MARYDDNDRANYGYSRSSANYAGRSGGRSNDRYMSNSSGVGEWERYGSGRDYDRDYDDRYDRNDMRGNRYSSSERDDYQRPYGSDEESYSTRRGRSQPGQSSRDRDYGRNYSGYNTSGGYRSSPYAGPRTDYGYAAGSSYGANKGYDHYEDSNYGEFGDYEEYGFNEPSSKRYGRDYGDIRSEGYRGNRNRMGQRSSYEGDYYQDNEPYQDRYSQRRRSSSGNY